MNRQIYALQIRSLRSAVEHLGMMDLRELGDCALVHGTPEDRALIDAARTMLDGLPPSHWRPR